MGGVRRSHTHPAGYVSINQLSLSLPMTSHVYTVTLFLFFSVSLRFYEGTEDIVSHLPSIYSLSSVFGAFFWLELGTCRLIFMDMLLFSLANITTAVYLATIARTGTSCYSPSYRFESSLTQCLMSGVISGPILMVWTYMCGDLEKTIHFHQLFSAGFMVLRRLIICVHVNVLTLLLRVGLAVFLYYSIFLNTTLNSALTQTICGNIYEGPFHFIICGLSSIMILFTVGLGWMLFGGLPFDLMNVIRQLLLVSSALVYMHITRSLGGIRKAKNHFLVLDFAMEVPRRSLAASLSPLRLIDGLPRRRSFNYNQMPEEPIKLTVLKLDGSSFDIQVSKTATVGELKMAVEAAFSHLPITGVGKVSWPHVWAQFCLSYGDQRLLNEADYLIEFGIKDGDQLRFIRHISNYCTMMVNHKSKTPHVSSLKQLKLFSLKPETWKKKGTQGLEDGVDSVTKTQPSFLSTVLGGWLSYKSTPSQRGTKHRNVTASTSSHLRAFNNLIARFRFKCYSEKDVWNRKKLISENMK
ncbi:hypothetical protein HID58_040537 [Brassica napus]|uniref:SNRNP25 ubiquitin-like domain-containing protein n=1 Tax=Brassica napus TaxID=3708 RepID=A0ABQ8B8B2_BRANA|nr:hypothetical protein HID58_040537 [Brassica napus]